MNFNFELGYAWVWRFFFTWGFMTDHPTVSFYDKHCEREIHRVTLSPRNAIVYGSLIVFLFVSICSTVWEFFR